MYSKKIMDDTVRASLYQDPPKWTPSDSANQTADLNIAEMSRLKKCEEVRENGGVG